MSGFGDLFGSSAALTDLSIDKLFSSAPGPVTKGVKRVFSSLLRPIRKSTAPESSPADDSLSESNKDEDSKDDQEVEDPTESSSKKLKKERKRLEENEDLESTYYGKLLGDSNEAVNHETVKPAKKERQTAAKTIDMKELEMEQAERTVFVGNVLNDILLSRQLQRTFRTLFEGAGAIESTRFRSISFDENLPRKVAFAKKSLHKLRDTINAYIVYKEKECSRKAPGMFNATIFEEHHLRVDHVAHPAPKDNQRTIFVGNLDFEEREEQLWRYFNKHTNDDVISVRVVRDSKTNVGKGFALVTFGDSLLVNKALMLDKKLMPIEDSSSGKKPRSLRISRAKSHAKPSTMSPNHFDNTKRQHAANKQQKSNLSDSQRTRLGRALLVLGKADRATLGRDIIEGQRAAKGSKIAGIKGLKSAKGKAKKPRITTRASKFKDERDRVDSELKQRT